MFPRDPAKRRVLALTALALIATGALLLITQQAAAAGLGRLVAGLWVSTMDVVLRLIGSVFGA